MSLLLDARRHAMLRAQDLELWWQPLQAGTAAPARQPAPEQPVAAPQPAETAPATPAAPLPAQQAQPAAASAAPVTEKRQAPSSANTPAPAAQTGMAAAQWRCLQPGLLFADGAAQQAQESLPAWLFITDHFAELGEEAAMAEQLFHNMLRAMRLYRQPQVWHGSMRRIETAAVEPPGAVVSLPGLVGALTPRAIVLMGRVAAQTMLQSPQPLGVLRRQAHWAGGIPVVATYSPSYLLRSPHAKADAWADLRLALQLAHNAQAR